jgi:hypothetical protein
LNEIPASIPSNQLTSSSLISFKKDTSAKKKDEYDFDENENSVYDIDDDTNTQGHFRLYIKTNDKQQAAELEDISINLDSTVNNSSLNNNQANSSLKFTSENDEKRNDFDFDELAMLCSGNFKADDRAAKSTKFTGDSIELSLPVDEYVCACQAGSLT